MKLLVVTAAYPSPTDPWRAVFLENLHRELISVARGALEIVVVAPKVHDGDPLEETRTGVRILRFVYPSGGQRLKVSRPSLCDLARYFHSASRLGVKVARELAPDGILAHWVVPAGAIAARIARRTGIAYAVWAHGSDLTRYARRAPFRLLARRTLARARATFTVSRELRRIATDELGAAPEKTMELPMGVSDEFCGGPRRSPSRRGDLDLDLLAIGDLTREKGYEDLLEALEIVWRRGRRVRLRIVGAGPLETWIRTKLDHAPEGALELQGTRAPGEIADLLRAADGLVHPSWAEGAPLAVMEALACGTPVIATAVGGIPDLVVDEADGWLVPPRDPAALAEVIEQLALAPDRLEEARRRIAERAPDFSVRSRAEILWPRLLEIFPETGEVSAVTEHLTSGDPRYGR